MKQYAISFLYIALCTCLFSCSRTQMTKAEITAKALSEFESVKASIQKEMAAECEANIEFKVNEYVLQMQEGSFKNPEPKEGIPAPNPTKILTDLEQITQQANALKANYKAELEQQCEELCIQEATRLHAQHTSKTQQSKPNQLENTRNKQNTLPTPNRKRAPASMRNE